MQHGRHGLEEQLRQQDTLGSGICMTGFAGDGAHLVVVDSCGMSKALCADDDDLCASFVPKRTKMPSIMDGRH